jgi:uncharacterized protein DUF2721
VRWLVQRMSTEIAMAPGKRRVAIHPLESRELLEPDDLPQRQSLRFAGRWNPSSASTPDKPEKTLPSPALPRPPGHHQGAGHLHQRLTRPESGKDQCVTLTAVNAISDMVAPVVLLTVGGVLSNGLITIYSDINNRMREMTRERLEIRRGPAGQLLDEDSVAAIDRERLHEIDVQLPMMLRRHRLTGLSVLTIYVAIAVFGLSIVVIAVAVSTHDEIAARVALGLVVAGTIIMLLGLAVAATSVARSADAITYAVERTTKPGLSVVSLEGLARYISPSVGCCISVACRPGGVGVRLTGWLARY